MSSRPDSGTLTYFFDPPLNGRPHGWNAETIQAAAQVFAKHGLKDVDGSEDGDVVYVDTAQVPPSLLDSKPVPLAHVGDVNLEGQSRKLLIDVRGDESVLNELGEALKSVVRNA